MSYRAHDSMIMAAAAGRLVRVPYQSLVTRVRLIHIGRTNHTVRSIYTRGSARYARKPPRSSILVRWVNSRGFLWSMAGLGALISFQYIRHLGMKPPFLLRSKGIIYLMCKIEEVPISGRKRFNIIKPEAERELAEEQYQRFLKEVGPGILPPWHPDVLKVKKVMARLISGLSKLEDQGISESDHGAAVTAGKAPWTGESGLDAWTVHVVDAPILNAVVLPG